MTIIIKINIHFYLMNLSLNVVLEKRIYENKSEGDKKHQLVIFQLKICIIGMIKLKNLKQI